MNFELPYCFFFILPLLILFIASFLIKKRGVVFSTLGVAGYQMFGFKSYLHILPLLLYFIAGILLVIALANPLKEPQKKEYKKNGIAIELVVDNSSSMAENILDGIKVKRKIDLVKEVISDFVLGKSDKIKGRENDLVGLVTFARYANTVYPLTFNRTPFIDAINAIDIANRKVDGTHFGIGLQLAIARLETISKKEDKHIKSKIIIFLTDGQNRYKDIDPIDMARVAKEKGIKIYTIAFGTQQQELLSHIALISGGSSYEASNANLLSKVYSDIDLLEKSAIGDFKEQKGESNAFIFIFYATFFIYLSCLLQHTILRRFP